MIAEDVGALIQLFDGSDLVELSVERGGRKLFLRKGEQAASDAMPLPEEPSAPPLAAVKAHMVGIFFWSRDKAAKPAVKLDQVLGKGQVVGFVEAMGIMNELESPLAGRVVEIAAANGQPVEYGQPIVVLQPD